MNIWKTISKNYEPPLPESSSWIYHLLLTIEVGTKKDHMDSLHSCITFVCITIQMVCVYTSTLCCSKLFIWSLNQSRAMWRLTAESLAWHAAKTHVFSTELGCGSLQIWKDIWKDPPLLSPPIFTQISCSGITPLCRVNLLFLEIVSRFWFVFTEGHANCTRK